MFGYYKVDSFYLTIFDADVAAIATNSSFSDGNGNVNSSQRIGSTGDSTIGIQNVPHQVRVKVEVEFNNGDPTIRVDCGGSIIHDQAVLTAAHCITLYGKVWKFRYLRKYPAKSLSIRAGSDYRLKDGVTRNVKKSIPHPKYTVANFSETNRVDMALLILDKSLTPFTDKIKAIEVPRPGRWAKLNDSADPCYVTGWGETKTFQWNQSNVPEPVCSDRLKGATLKIIKDIECQKMIEAFEKFGKNKDKTKMQIKESRMHKSDVCAYADGKGPCRGDSGGPLTCFARKTKFPYLMGLVRAGFGCGNRDNGLPLPSFYTKVVNDDFINWMYDSIKGAKLDPGKYFDKLV